MKRTMLTLLSFICLLITPNTFAKNKATWVKLRKAEVGFSLPAKWNHYKDMLGLPLVFVSPRINAQRITVSVTPTGLNDIPMDPKTLKKEQNGWFSGRRKFVSTFKGAITGTFPYSLEKWKHIPEVHAIGYKYKVADKHFVSHSFYFYCKEQLFHVKSLYEQNVYTKGLDTVESIGNTLRCR